MLLAIGLDEWSSFDLAAVSRRSALALVYLTVIGSSAFVAYVWLCASPRRHWWQPMPTSIRWLRFCSVTSWPRSR